MTASIPTAATVKTRTVQGGNLFTLAAEHLGSIEQWTRVAVLNGLSDPWLPDGVLLTLKIPPFDATAGTGGVLGV